MVNSASLHALEGKTIGFIGYGNQGRAQCLNLLDVRALIFCCFFLQRLNSLHFQSLAKESFTQAPNVIVANPDDAYAAKAQKDNIVTSTDFADIAAKADVLFLLIPDETQPALFNQTVAPAMKPGCCLVIASGYNYFFKKLHIDSSWDVALIAPRMIGTSVRGLYQQGKSFPCFLCIEQDATGSAKQLCLALSHGIGALKGAIWSSSREEVLIDLFSEQALMPSLYSLWVTAYSTLKSLGASDEALCAEMWMSKEPAEVFEKAADDGFIKQLDYHSTVARYGQLVETLRYDREIIELWKKNFRNIAQTRILNGAFEEELSDLEERGAVQVKLQELFAAAEQYELVQGEKKVRAALGL